MLNAMKGLKMPERSHVEHEVLDDSGMLFDVEKTDHGQLSARFRVSGRVMIDGNEFECDQCIRVKLLRRKDARFAKKELGIEWADRAACDRAACDSPKQGVIMSLENKSNEILQEARSLADKVESWADFTNAVSDPEYGLVAKAFPEEMQRQAFYDSKQYQEIKTILTGLMRKFGVAAGAHPRA